MIALEKHADALMTQLPKGVFITAKGKDKVNTMTIAWGHLGIVWSRPVFIAYVRYSRYTYDILREAEDFTINVPVEQDLKEALKIAGTESGRDIDKFQKASLTLKPAKRVKSPIIAECALHYECNIIYTQSQEPALIPKAIQTRHYPHKDTHIVFYGEIVDQYRID